MRGPELNGRGCWVPVTMGWRLPLGCPPRNLWAEPGASPNPKDAVEAAANRAICTRRLTLTQIQAAMATDWIALGRQLGVGG